MAESPARQKGGILRSYGRAHGRAYSVRQRSMLDEFLPEYRIELDELEAFVKPPYPVYLEIGFGCGEHLVHQAALHPDRMFLGAEPYQNAVANCVFAISERGVGNIRLFPHDVQPLLDTLPDACLQGVYILFPDPWPKKAHHKRRLINKMTLSKLARVMKQGATLQLATDHADYSEQMLEQLFLCPDFTWNALSPADWKNPPAEWVPTRYQWKAEKQGKNITFLNYTRR